MVVWQVGAAAMAKKTPTPQLSEELWQSKWQDRLAQCPVDKVTLRELQDQL